MKIVIDIPEDVYKYIMEMSSYTLGIRSGKGLLYKMLYAIRTGTPSPKGHGRLIDADDYYKDIKNHYFDNATVIRCTEIALHNAETIIEADTAESEGER